MKLNKADCIIAYNIDFSATTYFDIYPADGAGDLISDNFYSLLPGESFSVDIYVFLMIDLSDFDFLSARI